ncbi:MAG: hypothetical protein GXO81_13755 [Chlorobi bacterium]|nr:hypothetical protein [Chlorobiota bacterium]
MPDADAPYSFKERGIAGSDGKVVGNCIFLSVGLVFLGAMPRHVAAQGAV